MSNTSKVTSALSWQVLNITVQALFQFAFLMISARILPKEVHGAFAILNALVFVLSFASEGGVSSALIQRKEVNATHISISFYLTLALSLFMCFVTLLFSNLIETFYNNKVTAIQVRWASIIFVLKALGSVSRAFLVKKFKFKQIFIANTVSFFLGSICLMYVLAKLDYGIFALIFGLIITQLVQSILFYFFAKHSFSWKWEKEEFRQIAYFGSSFTLLRITNYFGAQVDKLLLGKFFSLPLLSVYEKGQYISKMPSKYIGNSIDSIIFSYFSKIGKEKKARLFHTILTVVGITTGYFAVFFYFNAELIISVLLGNGWEDSIPFLSILVWTIPSILFARLGDVIVRSENKMFKSVPIKIGFLVTNVVGILLFKDLPLVTLTKILVVINWLHCLAMLLLSRHLLKMSINHILKPIFVSIIACLFLVFKYWFVAWIVDMSNIFSLIIGIISDVLLFLILINVFKENRIVQFIMKTVQERFIKNK